MSKPYPSLLILRPWDCGRMITPQQRYATCRVQMLASFAVLRGGSQVTIPSHNQKKHLGQHSNKITEKNATWLRIYMYIYIHIRNHVAHFFSPPGAAHTTHTHRHTHSHIHHPWPLHTNTPTNKHKHSLSHTHQHTHTHTDTHTLAHTITGGRQVIVPSHNLKKHLRQYLCSPHIVADCVCVYWTYIHTYIHA